MPTSKTIQTGPMNSQRQGVTRTQMSTSAGNTSSPHTSFGTGTSTAPSDTPSNSQTTKTPRSKDSQGVASASSNPANSAEQVELQGDPINMATGEFIYEDNDFALPDITGDYLLNRRYTAATNCRQQKSLGTRWSFGCDTAITRNGETTTVTLPDGKTVDFSYQDGIYRNQRGGSEAYTLQRPEDNFHFTDQRNETFYTYGSNGVLLYITDRNGNRATYTYGTYGIQSITLATGATLTFTWKDMKVSEVTDHTGRCVHYRYTGGLLTAVIRCDGSEIFYAYDEEKNLASITDALGCTYLTNRYDENGRVIEQFIADGGHYSYAYDTAANRSSYTDLETGAVTCYTYNAGMDVTGITYPDGSTILRELDECGNKLRETDRCGAITTYAYDSRGHCISRRDPSGLITQWAYEGNRLMRVWDNTGRKTTYRSDGNGNPIEIRTLLDIETGAEAVFETDYDAMGRILKQTENQSTVTTYRYRDKFPYPIEITAPDGTITTYRYDACGRLMEQTTAEITERYTYTDYNKIQTVTNGEGETTAYYYDAAWRRIKIVEPEQNRTHTIEDAGEEREYDALDRLIGITDACGRRVTYRRNTAGVVTEERHWGNDSEAEETIYLEYDACGNRIRETKGRYGSVRYFYDSCGRMTGQIPALTYHPDTDEGIGYRYERDSAGRITTVWDPYGILTDHYSYDRHGNVLCHRHHFPDTWNSEELQPFSLEQYPGDCYSYNAVGQMTEKRELCSIHKEGTPLYGITRYRYDTYGRLVQETAYTEPQSESRTPQGACRTVQHSYDTAGNLLQIQDSTGACITYEYDIHHRKTGETRQVDRQQNQKMEYRYDRCGRIIEERTYRICQPKEVDTTYHNATIKSASLETEKPVRKNRFISLPKAEAVTEPVPTLLTESHMDYDKSGRIITIQTSEGQLRTYCYDNSGRQTMVTISGVSQSGTEADTSARQITCEYNEYGYQSNRTEAGTTVTYETDAFGNRLTQTAPDGGITRWRYDWNGNCISQITPEEYAVYGEDARGTLTEYDACNRLIRVTLPDGTLLQNQTYNRNGQLMEQRDAEDGCIRYHYDAGGRCIATETAAGVRQEYAYNAFGSATAIASGTAITRYEPDVWGRITAIHAPEDVKEQYAYDYMGNITQATDGEGHVRTYHRNTRGQVEEIGYADGIGEKLQYDRSGRITCHTKRSGNQIRYAYDWFGNLLEERVIVVGEREIESNTAAEEPSVEKETDAIQNQKRAANHVVSHTYTYDTDGSLLTAQSDGICYHYTYDACGRLASKSAGSRLLLRYTYDLNGNIKTRTDGTGKTTHYTYDRCGRLSEIEEDGMILAAYAYTKTGRTAVITCGDIVTAYTYDADGNTTRIQVQIEEVLFSEISYAYDRRGNCMLKESTWGADASSSAATGLFGASTTRTEYTYDGLNQLTGVRSGMVQSQTMNPTIGAMEETTQETFGYDKAGNRIRHTRRDGTEETYTYGVLNELLEIQKTLPTAEGIHGLIEKSNADVSTCSFTYDRDGNVISDGRGLYAYDGFGQMTKAVMEEGETLVCRYDAEGLRHEIEENGRLIQFFYEKDGELAYEESEETGTIRYIRGNRRLVASDSEYARTYYHYAADAIGSVLAVLEGNEFEGEKGGSLAERVVCRAAYDAFGNRSMSENRAVNRYGFSGAVYDEVSRQCYLKSRYYVPETGRFMQMDSYHGAGLNLYAYVWNNPVGYVDPEGHCGEKVQGVAGVNGEGGSGSKLQEVFDTADNYNLSDDTFNNHILERHGPNSTYNNKSHFNADFDIKGGIDSTLKGDNFIVKSNTGDRSGYIFEQTFKDAIGVNSKGKPIYTLKVVIDEGGSVITAFPKK